MHSHFKWCLSQDTAMLGTFTFRSVSKITAIQWWHTMGGLTEINTYVI